MSNDEIKAAIRNGLLTAKGKIIPMVGRPEWVDAKGFRGLVGTIESLFPEGVSLSEAIYCVLYDLPNGGKCKHCRKPTIFINSIKGYRPFCSSSCNALYNVPFASLSGEARKSRAQKISVSLRGRSFSKETKSKMSAAAKSPDVQKKKADTCEVRYGVRNPGVLGAYSSASALLYIDRYIDELAVDPRCCMYNDGNGAKEFFRMISVPWSTKKLYVSYDLVVFADIEAKEQKNVGRITHVLEYQGPWHYNVDMLVGHEDEPATPYSTNRLTKWQQYTVDVTKARILLDQNSTINFDWFWERNGIREGLSY